MKMFQQHAHDLIPDAQQLKEFTQVAQFVDVSSSARWWFSERDDDPTIWGKDIPILASPWPVAWFEYIMPTDSQNQAYRRAFASSWIGMALNQFTVDDDEADAVLSEDDGIRRAVEQGFLPGEHISTIYLESRRAEIAEAVRRQARLRWICFATMHLYFRGRAYRSNLLKYLDESGTEIIRSYGATELNKLVEMTSVASPEWIGETASAMMHMLQAPIWFAVSLMHCKNVHLETIPAPHPKVQQKREKRGIPNVTFKTLVVEPMRQQVRREAAANPTGEQNHIKRALHIARGHFKDYRDGPGLFGKYKGLYWWDMHVRGSADSGVVVKDYKVQPPSDAPADIQC